jgi:UPF0755 protein
MEEGAAVKKWVVITLTIFLVLIVGAGFTGYWAYTYYENSINKPMSEGGQATETEVVIKSGSSTSQIAELLHNEGLIKDARTFRIYIKLNGLGGKLKAGKFALNTGMNAAEIADKIAKGDVKKDTVWLTIPEGYALKDIADAVEKAGLAKKDKFLEAAENGSFDYDFLKELPKRPVRLEGYLFPTPMSFRKMLLPSR